MYSLTVKRMECPPFPLLDPPMLEASTDNKQTSSDTLWHINWAKRNINAFIFGKNILQTTFSYSFLYIL